MDAIGDVTRHEERRTALREHPSVRHPRSLALIALTLGMRLALVGILVYAVTHQDLPQFHGKGMFWRMLLYPVVTFVVPAYWWFFGRRRGRGFPFALDLLLAVPPLFDSAGNALNMYDRVTWWDDFNHFVNPIFIAVALGLVLMRLPIGSWALAAFVTASSTTFGVIWELAEYLSFVKRSPEFNTAYEDTMGDLALDLAGSAVGAIIVVIAIRARRSLRQSGTDSTGVEQRPM